MRFQIELKEGAILVTQNLIKPANDVVEFWSKIKVHPAKAGTLSYRGNKEDACLISPKSCNGVDNWRSSAQLFGVDRRWLRALVRMERWSQLSLIHPLSWLSQEARFQRQGVANLTQVEILHGRGRCFSRDEWENPERRHQGDKVEALGWIVLDTWNSVMTGSISSEKCPSLAMQASAVWRAFGRKADRVCKPLHQIGHTGLNMLSSCLSPDQVDPLRLTNHPTKLEIPETAMCQNNDRAFTLVSTVSDLIMLPDNPTIGRQVRQAFDDSQLPCDIRATILTHGPDGEA
ncbi:uncharacterized protein CLUP02_10131 [Colletotrichum lupini]|uniref:Uncharacterized protein n=1 Tax=Colletotrichum lupini TaxID=145971 RepID=A0A9Q8SW61_9PEZI|nr:uncharacterized protein CLUP02_10131 [Colletotrichum lupini]UQC84634.1 hypothetical protein CLUP02_10131 [Colletotrichum lupini]